MVVQIFLQLLFAPSIKNIGNLSLAQQLTRGLAKAGQDVGTSAATRCCASVRADE